MSFTVQSSYGQTHAIGLAVVDWLGTLDQSKLAVGFEAQFLFIRKINLPDIPVWDNPASIYVFPERETGERRGMSTAYESEYLMNLLIQQRLAPDDGSTGNPSENDQCGLLILLRSQVLESLKKVSYFDLADAAHPVSKVHMRTVNSEQRIYTHDSLPGFHIFESNTLLLFKAAA